MAELTTIQWTDHTFNPWWGCAHVHAGCTHCYAEAFAKRTGKGWGVAAPRYVTSRANWRKPIAWNGAAKKSGVRQRVFCASMADVFEDSPAEPVGTPERLILLDFSGRRLWHAPRAGEYTTLRFDGCRPVKLHDLRRDLFRLIDATPWLDWLLLTKRPENISRMWVPRCTQYVPEAGSMSYQESPFRPNVWLGTSISDQATADQMLPHLFAAKRLGLASLMFVSAEPLLGPIHLQHEFDGRYTRNWLGQGGIDWLICGGESGSKARACDAEWIRAIVGQCRAAEVPVFVKQVGSKPFETNAETGSPFPCGTLYEDTFHGDHDSKRIRDRKGGDPAEWPEELRVREFPQVAAETTR